MIKIPSYIARVIQEQRELDLKISDLDQLVGPPNRPGSCRGTKYGDMLVRQLNLMISYSEILGDRIHWFITNAVNAVKEDSDGPKLTQGSDFTTKKAVD